MKAKITFFPVDNGDMTLIVTESGKRILIDANIRGRADDPDDEAPDVATMLRDRLERDSHGRLFVDSFLLSHPDQDHCSGLKRHFHLGSPDDWSEQQDKIFINELWSSPVVFRRAEEQAPLCEDAQAFNREARRRVKRFRDGGQGQPHGDQILILGEDREGKTDDLGEILVRIDEEFQRIAGEGDDSMNARLLGPSRPTDDTEEERLGKNGSSTILRLSLDSEGEKAAGRFLTGGDAEVEIWETLWDRQKDDARVLEYDVLQAPHHCSWRSLSHDSWSEEGEAAEVSHAARNALSQARAGCTIVSSSKRIADEDDDPPCIRAKREYEAIASEVSGEFACVADSGPDPLEFEITRSGPRKLPRTQNAAAAVSGGAIGGTPLAHG